MIKGIPIYQIISVVGSIFIIIFLFELVRRRKLKENYSLLWFAIAIVFLLISLRRDILVYIALLLGVDYAPAALFLVLIIGLYLLLIYFSLIISDLSEKNKNLSQEVGLLNLEIKKIKEWLKEKKII